MLSLPSPWHGIPFEENFLIDTSAELKLEIGVSVTSWTCSSNSCPSGQFVPSCLKSWRMCSEQNGFSPQEQHWALVLVLGASVLSGQRPCCAHLWVLGVHHPAPARCFKRGSSQSVQPAGWVAGVLCTREQLLFLFPLPRSRKSSRKGKGNHGAWLTASVFWFWWGFFL